MRARPGRPRPAGRRARRTLLAAALLAVLSLSPPVISPSEVEPPGGVRGYWIANAGQWPDDVWFRSAGGDVTAWVTTDGLWLVRPARHLLAGGSALIRFPHPSGSGVWSARAVGKDGPPFHFLGARAVRAESSRALAIPGGSLEVTGGGVRVYGLAASSDVDVFTQGPSTRTTGGRRGHNSSVDPPIEYSPSTATVTTPAGPLVMYFVSGDRAAAASSASETQPGVDGPVFATYFGGAGLFDRIKGIVHSNEVVVAVGETVSGDLPVSPGSLQPGAAGRSDGFAAAFDTRGGLVWATYLGGTGDETVGGAARGHDGGVLVAGGTWSADFPAWRRIGPGGAGDLFLVGLSADGARLTDALVAGGSGTDTGLAVGSGPRGTWVAGETRSSDWPEPAGLGAADALVLLAGAPGEESRVWRVGGASTDRATAVAVDNESGGALLAGTTFSPDLGGNRTGTDADGWAGWWSAEGPTWIDRFGGTGADTVAGAALLGGTVGVAGTTSSGDFPASAGAWSGVLSGPADAFLATFRASDGAPGTATLFGGAGYDGAAGLTAASGAFDLAGLTTLGVPSSPGARPFAGTVDAFAARADADGNVLAATHFGGSGFDEALAVDASIDPSGFVMGGSTSSNDLPTTIGAAMAERPSGTEPAFVASVRLPDEPPVGPPAVAALVHGWQGLGGSGTSCAGGPTAHPDSPVIGGHGASLSIGDILESAGYEVWHIHLDSSAQGTPPIAANAVCLRDQLDVIRGARSPRRIVLIGHSMGGLVARAYVEDDTLYQGDVDALVSFGAPHLGVPADLPLALLTFLNLDQFGGCDRQPALCELTTSGIDRFARRYPARREGVRYLAVGGALEATDSGWTGRLLGAWIPGDDDAIVPSESAVALTDARAIRPAEGHTPGSPALPIARVSYFGPFDGRSSSLVDCVIPFLTGGACEGASLVEKGRAAGGPSSDTPLSAAGAPGQEPPEWEIGVARTPVEVIELGAGEATTRTVRVSQPALIGVRWDAPGTGLTIVPPAQIESGDMGASAAVTDAPGGHVTLELAAPPDRATKAALVTVLQERGPALDVPADARPGASVPVRLIPSGAVPVGGQARLARPDGTVVTSTLREARSGVWEAALAAGQTPGVGLLSAVLRDAGGAELAASSSVRIGSDRLVITGRYEARPDGPDELGRFASLAIDIGLSALAPGPCAVSLKVVEPDTGAAIAPGGATCSAPTGAFTATVRIDGLLLRGRTAPWRIADVMVEDLTAHGAVLADMDQHGFLTRALDAGLFGPPWRALVPAALVPVRVARE